MLTAHRRVHADGRKTRHTAKLIDRNLNRVAERVKALESIDAVAVLAPLPPETTVSARLVATGRAIAPARRLDEIPALPSGARADLGRRVQQALADDRNDR